jgi:hypothetical protein
VQTGSEENPAPWPIGKRVLLRGQSDRGVKLIIQYLEPNLRINGSIHLPSLHGFMASTGTTALIYEYGSWRHILDRGKMKVKFFSKQF